METKAKRVPAGAQKNEIIVVVRRMNIKKKKREGCCQRQ